MTSSAFSCRVNYEAEMELEKGAGFQDPRPQILNMNGFTSKHAAEADPADYRLVDIVKTLVHLEAGLDGVKKIFEGHTTHQLSRFDQRNVSDNGTFQKKDGWTISTSCVSHHRVQGLAKEIKVGVWAQVKMKREIDLDEDSESWTIEDEDAQPVAEAVFIMGKDSICIPVSVSLQPTIRASIQPAQIELVVKAMTVLLLHRIAAFKTGGRAGTAIVREVQAPQTPKPLKKPPKVSKLVDSKKRVALKDMRPDALRKAKTLRELRSCLRTGDAVDGSIADRP